MKIVDIEPMLSFLNDNHDEKDWMVNQYNADWIYSWLESQPTIDPASLVNRGRWKLNNDGSGTCDQCHFTQKAVWDFDNSQRYCGVCGALMED